MEKRSFRSVPARLALLALAMLGAALLSLCLGAAAVSPREILSVLSGGGKGTTAASILLYVRLPRTLGCLLAGAALAVSGAVIQTVLANPLAAPNIIGVNSGAGLGVALCCAVLPTAAAAVPFAAFLGAFAGVMLVLLISEKAGASRMTLVLAGVAISGMFGAGIDAVLTVFPDSLIGYSDFRIGGLANLSMGKVAPAAWVILLCLGAALALANEMDVLALGADFDLPGQTRLITWIVISYISLAIDLHRHIAICCFNNKFVTHFGIENRHIKCGCQRTANIKA